MIKAAHSYWFGWVFDKYLSFAFRRHFRRIETMGEIRDANLPMLVIANHISWWDGFWILMLNKNKFRRRFHVMMLEDQLRKNMFLSKLGAFSIRKRSKTIRESLDYASAILQHTNNLLLVFPQGQISSQHDYPMVFQKGLDRIIANVPNPLQIVMVVNLTDYFTEQKPGLRQYIYSPEIRSTYSGNELEVIYNNFFAQCIEQQKALK
jgi:1-acyl-sn-glycerol-3-phosphate acyltransferase